MRSTSTGTASGRSKSSGWRKQDLHREDSREAERKQDVGRRDEHRARCFRKSEARSAFPRSRSTASAISAVLADSELGEAAIPRFARNASKRSRFPADRISARKCRSSAVQSSEDAMRITEPPKEDRFFRGAGHLPGAVGGRAEGQLDHPQLARRRAAFLRRGFLRRNHRRPDPQHRFFWCAKFG